MRVKRVLITRLEVYLVILAALLPLVVSSEPFHHVMTIAGLYALGTLGLAVFTGFAGQISIGHSAFLGLGAYSMAILSGTCQLPTLAGLAASGLVPGLAAWGIGRQLLKLREYFLALATIGLVQIFQVLATELEGLTGGVEGLFNLPWLSVFGFQLDRPLEQVYLVWGVVYLAFLFGRNLCSSGYGRAFQVVASSEDTARTLGLSPEALKTRAFVFSAVYAGLAGGLYACIFASVSPEAFGLDMSVMLVLMLIVGGVGSLPGALAGSVLITWLDIWLSGYQQYSLAVFGLILLLLLIFFPEGIFRGIGARWIDIVRSYAREDWRKELRR